MLMRWLDMKLFGAVEFRKEGKKIDRMVVDSSAINSKSAKEILFDAFCEDIFKTMRGAEVLVSLNSFHNFEKAKLFPKE